MGWIRCPKCPTLMVEGSKCCRKCSLKNNPRHKKPHSEAGRLNISNGLKKMYKQRS